MTMGHQWKEALGLFRANWIRLAAFQGVQQGLYLIHTESLSETMEDRAWLPLLIYLVVFLLAATEAASLIQLRASRRGESHDLGRIARLALLRVPDLLWAWLISVCAWVWGFALAIVPGFYAAGRLALAIPFSTLDGAGELAGRAPVRASLRLTRPMAWRLGLAQAPVLAISAASLWFFRGSSGSVAAAVAWGGAEFLFNLLVGGLWAAFLIVVSEQVLEQALDSADLAAVRARGVTYSWVRLILCSWVLVGLTLIPIAACYALLKHAGVLASVR